MSTSINLRHDTHAFLRRLAAAQRVRPDRPFCYRPIEGYAFAWILHPGFDDGTRMAGLLLLDELTQAGLLRFDDDGFPTRATTFVLTDAGISDGSVSRETCRSDSISEHIAVDESNLSACLWLHTELFSTSEPS